MALFASCRPTTPKQYIQPGEMEDLLVDYHLARAISNETNSRDAYQQHLVLQQVLSKHGLTQAQFDSSLVYYYTRADRFSAIYRRVADRLEEQAVALGASESDIGRYSALNAEGDTANIWADRSTALLMPTPPCQRLDFTIESDSTFRAGDSYLLQFMADFVYQDGIRDGVLYMAVDYPDTVVAQYQYVTYSGLSQMRFASRSDSVPQRIRGFFFLGSGNENSLTTTLKLLFINNIQLIRFHRKDEPKPATPVPTDSVARSTDSRGTEADSAGGGDRSGRRSARLLSTDQGTAHDRVDPAGSAVKIQPDR